MLLLVLIVAVILRFWQLSSVPSGLDWDEVSNVYNGYSILKTGADEFGQRFPVLFRAYDGYVPPVLIYLNSISVTIFGLGELAARFPNAILGTLTVWGIYLLVKQLSGKQNLALISALFLAITPWHILYSRVNTFAITPLFFIVFGTYFFLLAHKKSSFFALCPIFFILAIFSYFSAYIFVPLFVLFLAFTFRKKLSFRKLAMIVIPTLLWALLILFVLPGGQNRLRGVSIFNDPDILKTSTEEARDEGLMGRVLHNRRLIWGQEFLKGYSSNFRGDFLFGKGDAIERMGVGISGAGLMLVWFLPFLIVGIFYLIDTKPSGWIIWLSWLILAPIAAATSLPQPVSTRTTLMIVPLVVISAHGFYAIFGETRNLLAGLVRGGLILLLVLNLYTFLHHYFVHFPIEKSQKWFWGYGQLFDFLNTNSNSTKRVHFLFRQHDALDQIHMFLLFYNKIDPALWQANGGTRLGCIGTTGQFSFQRYNFVPLSCLSHQVDYSQYSEEDLIVTNHQLSSNPVLTINYLDGREAFYVFSYSSALSLSD